MKALSLKFFAFFLTIGCQPLLLANQANFTLDQVEGWISKYNLKLLIVGQLESNRVKLSQQEAVIIQFSNGQFRVFSNGVSNFCLKEPGVTAEGCGFMIGNYQNSGDFTWGRYSIDAGDLITVPSWHYSQWLSNGAFKVVFSSNGNSYFPSKKDFKIAPRAEPFGLGLKSGVEKLGLQSDVERLGIGPTTAALEPRPCRVIQHTDCTSGTVGSASVVQGDPGVFPHTLAHIKPGPLTSSERVLHQALDICHEMAKKGDRCTRCDGQESGS